MYFTGDLMYVPSKAGGSRKTIKKGDSLKGVLSDARIQELIKIGKASEKDPFAKSKVEEKKSEAKDK